MVVESPTYRCFLCNARVDSAGESGHCNYIHQWKVTVCSRCFDNNPDGIKPTDPVLTKLAAARIYPNFTKEGRIAWPEHVEALRISSAE